MPNFWREYEYKCPECGRTASPLDTFGNEILNKICKKVKRHQGFKEVRMVLVKLETYKNFRRSTL